MPVEKNKKTETNEPVHNAIRTIWGLIADGNTVERAPTHDGTVNVWNYMQRQVGERTD